MRCTLARNSSALWERKARFWWEWTRGRRDQCWSPGQGWLSEGGGSELVAERLSSCIDGTRDGLEKKAESEMVENFRLGHSHGSLCYSLRKSLKEKG